VTLLTGRYTAQSSEAFLSQDALQMITTAVLEACDELDGVQDGLINDPTSCHFNISTLECSAGTAPVENNVTVCLTAAQLDNANKFYSGPEDSRNGKQVYPGFALGSEIEWAVQEASLYLDYAVPVLQNLVFKNLSYDYTTFDWASDVDAVDQYAHPLIDEISPNLTAFKERGGKLIVTQGNEATPSPALGPCLAC
jgi:feruloyl esterase